MAKKYKHVWATDRNNPQASYREDLMSSNEEQVLTILKHFNPCRYKVIERSHMPSKLPKGDPFLIRSVLKSNCKRFLKNAKRENFKIKPEIQLKNIHSNHGGNYICQYNEVKEKLHPVSVLYVSKTLEHQVKDKYAFQKIQFFSGLRSPETHFRHAHTATNEEMPHQSPLASFKVQCLVYTKLNVNWQLTQTRKTDQLVFGSSQRDIPSQPSGKLD